MSWRSPGAGSYVSGFIVEVGMKANKQFPLIVTVLIYLIILKVYINGPQNPTLNANQAPCSRSGFGVGIFAPGKDLFLLSQS